MNTPNVPRGRIDVHAHVVPPFYVRAVEDAGFVASVSAGYPAWTPELALAFMADHDIGYAINSISPPGVHFGDNAKAQALARRCNEYLAELSRDYPNKFGAIGILPLPNVELALAEIDHVYDTLKLDGVVLFASYGTSFMGDSVFDPILAALDARDAVVFVHPNSHPSSLSLGMKLPTFLVEFPLATTRVAANLIFSGALERFPRIKFILAHFGGTVPYLAWRLSMAPLIDERFRAYTPQRVTDLVRSFYFESAQAAGPGVVAALAETADPQRLLFGTDWPYCPPSVTVAGDATLAASTLTSSDILHANTVRLFPRLQHLQQDHARR
jgi:predicted TIM-barrel fold metal-dependent hydrolase